MIKFDKKLKSVDFFVLIFTFIGSIIAFVFFSNYAIVSQEHIFFPSPEILTSFNKQIRWVINTRNVNDLYLLLGPFHYIFFYLPLEIFANIFNYYNIVQLLTGLSMVLSPCCFYFSFKKYFSNKLYLGLSCIVYTFNPYLLERFVSGHTFVILIWPFYPIIFKHYLDFVKERKIISIAKIFLFSYFSIILSGQFYLILLIFFILPFLVIFFFYQKYTHKLEYILKSGILLGLLALPFAINTFYALSISQQTVSLNTEFNQTFERIFLNSPIISIFTLSNSNFKFAQNIYGTGLIYFVIYILCLVAAIQAKHDRKGLAVAFIVLYSMLLTIISRYLNVPLLRDITKLTLVYVVVLPLLFYYLFIYLKNKYLISIITFLNLFMGIFPYTPLSNNQYLQFTRLSKIESGYYNQIVEYAKDKKVFVIPYLPDVRYEYNNPNSLTMTDFMQNNSGMKMLYMPYGNFKNIRSYLPENLDIEALKDFVSEFNIKYLYFRKDLDLNLYSKSYKNKVFALEEKVKNNYKKTFENKYATFYKTDQENDEVKVFSTKENLNKIEYSYTKISPVEYNIHLKNFNSEIRLELLSNFDLGWSIFINQKDQNRLQTFSNRLLKLNQLKTQHIEKSPYGNTWYFSKEDVFKNFPNSYYKLNDDKSIEVNLKLYFIPQIYTEILISTSLFLLTSSVLYILFINFYKKARHNDKN